VVERRRIPRRWLVAAALALAALAVLAVVLLESGSPKRTNADTGVPPGDTTTTVTRRTLSESSTVDGTLGYGSKLELYDRLAGTFTWLPAVGAVIGRGGTLFRVNDLPVALMYGSAPAYRTLTRGVGDGPDVRELNQNLIDLGFDPYGAISDDESFGEATAAAVRRWQKSEGLPETGKVELGRIVFAPGARRVTELHVSLGQDPPGEEPASKSPTTPASKTPTAPKSPSRNSHKPGAGSGAGASTAVLATTSTQQIVQLAVKAEQQQLAHIGETVPVTLPGGSVVHGRISNVGTVASESKGNGGEKGGGEKGGSGGEGESPTISVTVTLDHAVARLDQAPVSVELVRSIRRDVLTVPATALIATAGGGYAVEALEGARRVVLAVTPGMFAGGYVEVEGAGLREGLSVIEAQ
jgi:membrane fusion protein, multidrug efflux system